MSTRLAHQTQKTAGIGNGMRTATIAAVSGSVVTLSVSGGLFSSGVGVVGSYIPAVGDTVAVFRQDSSWLVLGVIGTSLGPQPRATQTGTESVSFTTLASFVLPVVFPIPFAVQPVVLCDIANQAGAANRWIVQGTVPTTVGFSIWARASDGVAGSWVGIPVDWVATARA